MGDSLGLSEVAREDLKSIGRYIGEGQHRPSTAAMIMREISSHCDHLARLPYTGTARPDLDDSLRIASWKRWVIVFRPSEDGVDVLRIVDGSRDFAQLF
jgi:toxin ParE1/3/4